jgi:hypothetical protein
LHRIHLDILSQYGHKKLLQDQKRENEANEVLEEY